ncbi:Beta-glucan synthesis-associated protein KRE6 OS=Saccharomyces cerevisiae (strain ATCC 204508 / S288c) GN=KRE6 PE=1 SV=2 [Rhizoctonia solani AG-1 IB]|uniref:Beta-glucan synthesis-associated protein KRE6 n=1 Tax=Thanatephorus cucumeris (strain AG1-IB / isolate 7/3/14) TaxID=1108050 RepID=A0A0B7FM65_THACB|nr:Beta-glucan synthesis-associated protein KRE6 OS=Saccharomyces cerevisiae (strain ATCC 204508 / S288c) GN=KRE6 PE=1 SV=2 [Rhizoctonia solani AG-1 IB]
MSRRQPSKIELPSDVPTNTAYGNRSPLSPHSTLNVPLMMRERNVEAAMMKPPTNGLYSSAAASTSNLSLASRADTLQCSSGLSKTNQACYEEDGGCFAVYGFEYKPGNDGYILWTNDNKPAWKIYGAGMGPDDNVKIGHRPVPQEPMYMIVNLGISPQFGGIDFEHLTFPATMLVDWVRVYQPKDNHNIGCDPEDFPTRDYINEYIEAYTNPNLTTWVDDYKQKVPKNRLVDQC